MVQEMGAKDAYFIAVVVRLMCNTRMSIKIFISLLVV